MSNSEQKFFILHPSITFYTTAQLLEHNESDPENLEVWNRVLNGELNVFYHKLWDDTFIVPLAIGKFMQYFLQANTLLEATKQFAEEANCKVEEIKAVTENFFKKIRKEGLIVEPSKITEFDQRDEYPILFPENEIVEEYWKITSTLSTKKVLSVQLAENITTGKCVVVKAVCVPDTLTEKQYRKYHRRFNQEFRLMRELKADAGMCKVLKLGKKKNGFYAFLEFIEGKDPRKFLEHNQPEMKSLIWIASQMTRLVAHIHEKGILHGDIHLSNFLIEKDGKVRMIDFDLSFHATPKRGERVHHGGVANYLPPEKIAKNSFSFVQKEADFPSEVWQTGLCLYYLFHGILPFSGMTWEDLVTNITSKEPKYSETMPNGMKQLLQKCLQKNPEHRFRSASELYASFQNTFETMLPH